jgi:hypothetical protein
MCHIALASMHFIALASMRFIAFAFHFHVSSHSLSSYCLRSHIHSRLITFALVLSYSLSSYRLRSRLIAFALVLSYSLSCLVTFAFVPYHSHLPCPFLLCTAALCKGDTWSHYSYVTPAWAPKSTNAFSQIVRGFIYLFDILCAFLFPLTMYGMSWPLPSGQ